MNVVARLYRILGRNDQLMSLAYRKLKKVAKKNHVTFAIDGFNENTLYIAISSGTMDNIDNFLNDAFDVCSDYDIRLNITYIE